MLLAVLACCRVGSAAECQPWKVDFRYTIPWWQTLICLPDDWQKTVVGKDGEMFYDYPGKFATFQTRVTCGLAEPTSWVKQELASPRVPIVRTLRRGGAVEVVTEAFAVPPVNCGAGVSPAPENAGGTPAPQMGKEQPPRYDVVLVRLRNTGDTEHRVTPTVTIDSQTRPEAKPGSASVVVGNTRLHCSEPIAATQTGQDKLVLRLAAAMLPAHGERAFAVTFARKGDCPNFRGHHAQHGGENGTVPFDAPGPTALAEAEVARQQAERFWTSGRLPYDRIQVPDPGIQALLDSSIRTIYQAREILDGLPAFHVGPTCYRMVAVVDGSFLLEAVTYLGRGDEARAGIRYFFSHQRPDGGFGAFSQGPSYWKESGIMLWAAARHAQLTGDKAWLEGVWPKLERAASFIHKLRQRASADPKAPHHGLMPPGFSDGGLAGDVSEYTNVYWNLVGIHAAIEAAHWLGKAQQAVGWQREYDDFYATFRRAADRDTRTDPQGNRYVPINMLNAGKQLPQRAQWAFCHAVFPGKLFPPGDPLVRGNMAMLKATEREGMVCGTGWAAEGIWGYFGSFYAHDWLWLGDGQKAAAVLYAFANHASPLLCWREEQALHGKPYSPVGDMPHNWASAEFIRLVRHLLVLERSTELHLLEGMPAAWAKPGAVTRLKSMPTEFGPMSLEVAVAADGKTARVRVETPTRSRPERIVLHLGGWTASDAKATLELPTAGTVEREVGLK
jgi:hypothetical protein